MAAPTVLEQLADTTEHTALTSALIYRYVQVHDLWKDRPFTKSAVAFLDALDNSDHVKASIVIGTSAQVSKWRNIRQIESAWGADWFEKIPECTRDPRWIRLEEWLQANSDPDVAECEAWLFDRGVRPALDRGDEAANGRGDSQAASHHLHESAVDRSGRCPFTQQSQWRQQYTSQCHHHS